MSGIFDPARALLLSFNVTTECDDPWPTALQLFPPLPAGFFYSLFSLPVNLLTALMDAGREIRAFASWLHQFGEAGPGEHGAGADEL
jgi:hypothetical protein